MPTISENEEIKFIGEYDRSNAFIQTIPGFPGGNAGYVTNIAGVCGNTFISNNYTITGTGLLGSDPYADETYSMVSYPYGNKEVNKLGSLIWTGTYREILTETGETAPSIQEFVVSGSSGVYSNVTRVIMDFNNIVRILYFIGPKN
jgi:hypothetical protein